MSDKVHTLSVMAAILQAAPTGTTQNGVPIYRTVDNCARLAHQLYAGVEVVEAASVAALAKRQPG